MRKIGSLWKNEKDGRKFLTGELDIGVLGKIKIGIFPNNKKEKDNHPTHVITVFDGKK